MSQVTAISPQRFGKKAWLRPSGYAFANQVNIVPVMASELTELVATFPIGFVRTENTFQMVAITALRPGTNLFVAPDGRWMSDYVPALIRSYPFRLAKLEGREDDILCFVEGSGLLVDVGMGEPFYDEAGAPSKSMREMLDFVSQIEQSRVVTQAAVDALKAAELIQPWLLTLQEDGRTVPVHGLYRINEAALNALPDETFLALRKTVALPLAYAHLLSMNQLSLLGKAAEEQRKFREQQQIQVSSQSKHLAGLGVGLVGGEILKFQ